MKYFTYVLHSQLNGTYYIGQTNNLSRRIERHNRGQENSSVVFTNHQKSGYYVYTGRDTKGTEFLI